MQIARIQISGTDYKILDNLAKRIKITAEKFGSDVHGPIPLPTKKLRINTRKAPDGEGSETYEKWEMRVHKRVLDVGVNERVLRRIMRLEIPPEVHIEIELKG